MEFVLEPILDQEKDRNPYIIWGEDIAENLDRREFFSIDRDDAGDLRKVYLRCKNPDLSAEQAFDLVKELTGVEVSEVERALSGTLLEESGTGLEFIAMVNAHWPLRPELDPVEHEEAFLDNFEIIASGPRVFSVSGPAGTGSALPTGLGPDLVRGEGDAQMVVAGIIDDGIPYLNRRFFDGATPRIKSLMLQTYVFFPQGSKLDTSRVLDEGRIATLRQQADAIGERAVYKSARKSDPLLAAGTPAGIRKTVEQAESHGAFILDLMAGAPPTDVPGTAATPPNSDAQMRQIPILAAQLPAQSVDDTSGARLELPIIEAMRWMIAKSAQLSPVKLVLNLSFGVSAGSKDGNSFMETMFERLVAKAARLGVTLDLVLPFGNEFLSRGVQLSPLRPQPAFGPDPWLEASAEIVLARADETPSFVEIRAKDRADLPEDLEVAVKAPSGLKTPFRAIAPGQSVALILPDGIPGRIFHIPARRFFGGNPQGAHLLLAMCPTAEPRQQIFRFDFRTSYPEGLTLAAPGRWTIFLKQPAAAANPMEAVFQVQRDDSAFGYHNRGLQTILDHENAHKPDKLFRDFSGLGRQTDITRSGTNTAYVSRARPKGVGGQIHAIGAARTASRSGEAEGDVAPAYYASRRAAWSAASNPDRGVALDTEISNPGVTASGTASGSAMRLTGSSAAAAIYSRRLLLGTAQDNTIGTAADQDRLGNLVSPLPTDLSAKKRKIAR